MLKDIQSLIKERDELNKQIELAQAEQKKKENQIETKIVNTPFGKFEVETKIHHLNKTYTECEKDCPKGWEIATYEILQYLRNNQAKEFNLINTWEFVKQPDKISNKNKFVAVFFAYSDGANLYCDRIPSSTNDGLGVRWIRRIK